MSPLRLPNPLDALADVAALARAGALRPMGPRTTLAVGRQLIADGVKPHLIYTIHGTRDAGRPALVAGDRVITWGETLERTTRLANWMLTAGLAPGDAVAIMLPNRPEFIETQAAALRIGAVTSYINPRAPEADARDLLERTGAKLLVTHRPEVGAGRLVLEAGEHYEQAIAGAPDDEPRVPRDAAGKVVIFTSGTTGRPKGAVRNMSEGSALGQFAGLLRVVPFRHDDVHMVVAPLYHSSGSGFATIAQVLGSTTVLVERFSPETFCDAVQRHRVTTTAVVPTMLHELARWDGARDYDLSSLRVVICTGSPLREELREQAREIVGDVLYDLYGSTEMAWVSVATPSDQRERPGTVGRPVPGVQVRILDPERRPVPRGEIGELWASNKLMMEGYLADPDLTGERMRDGYVSVRDLAFQDARGFLFVVDRADDMIISGGVNVYPAEAEVALGSHPKVDEVAVVGVPDPKWGQRLVAAVVASGEVSAEELIAHAKERVGYAAVPKEIRFVDALPRNDVGKVAKKRLVESWNA